PLWKRGIKGDFFNKSRQIPPNLPFLKGGINCMYLRTDAIVISKRNFRENDRIITFYSRIYGKLDVLVKGIRKIENRFGSTLELFTYNEILLWEKKKGALLILTQCQTKESFFKIRSDLKKIAAAFYITDLAGELTKEKDKNIGIFNLLFAFLYLLENTNKPGIIVSSFQLRLLYILGFGPELDKCVNCKNVIIKDIQYFSFPLGGIICKNCVRFSSSNISLNHETAAIMKKIIRIPLNRIENVVVSQVILKKIEYLFSLYIFYHLDKKIKSKKIMEKLFK
ncbi:MAG: DNA repair protein RecO, partial [bacterium]